jgi:hypothetical protein
MTPRAHALLLFAAGLLGQRPQSSFAASTFALACLFYVQAGSSKRFSWQQILGLQWLPLAFAKAFASIGFLATVLPRGETFAVSFALALPLSLCYILAVHLGHLAEQRIALGPVRLPELP